MRENLQFLPFHLLRSSFNKIEKERRAGIWYTGYDRVYGLVHSGRDCLHRLSL